MSSAKSSFYLFNADGLVGPFSAEKIESMKETGSITKYVWIINEQLQSWEPVIAAPKENPFLKSKQSLGEREISAAFLVREKPFLGLIKGMHSFGVELFIAGESKRKIGIAADSTVALNIVDETNLVAVNTKMKFQSFEDQVGGVLLRFGWIQPLTESL